MIDFLYLEIIPGIAEFPSMYKAHTNVQPDFSTADLTKQLYKNLQKEQVFHHVFYFPSYSSLTS